MNHKDIRTALKALMDKDPKVKEIVKSHGNWTQFSTEKLHLIYDEVTNKKTAKEPAKEPTWFEKEIKKELKEVYYIINSILVKLDVYIMQNS